MTPVKTLYAYMKSIPAVIYAGVFVLSAVNMSVSSQTANDTTNSVLRITVPADSLRTDTVKNAAAEIAELQQRKDVKTSIEITEKGDTITHYIYEAFDFGEIYTSGSAINANARKAPVDGKATSDGPQAGEAMISIPLICQTGNSMKSCMDSFHNILTTPRPIRCSISAVNSEKTVLETV